MRDPCRLLTSTVPALCVLLLLLGSGSARAQVVLRQLPRSMVVEALAEPQPTAFAPVDFSVADFSLQREPGGDTSIDAQLEAGSLEWVRTARYLVVPRAVVRVSAKGAQRGLVLYAGSSQPMAADATDAHAAVPVGLIAGPSYPILVQVWRDGQLHTASFHVRFTPRPEHGGEVLFDSSCSPYGLHLRRGAIPRDSWLYVGCAMVITQRDDHDSPNLDLYMLWDQAGPDVSFEGAPAAPTVDTVWLHRVTDSPGASALEARGQRAELSYQLPPQLHPGFMGVGVGPYYYALHDDKLSLKTPAPLLTLYAGYTVNPTTRIVYFNATVMQRHGFIDQGVYVWLEQLRALDDRVSLNLLLGANGLVYSRHNRAVGRLSAPQGIELVFRDFLATNRNLTGGAFLYPAIAGRSYYNVWLRWGSGQFFGEINYIAWQEPHAGGASKSESLGLSFGIPALRFLRFL